MNAFLPVDDTLHASQEQLRDMGASLAENYAGALPYPHISIDNFLPEHLLNDVLSSLGELPKPEHQHDRAQERLKFSYSPHALPGSARRLFWFFNSRAFLAFLESLTRIEGLIPDPYYLGGGVHELRNGGHLDIHADFNLHPKLKLERRINVLVYLNKGWLPEFGGQFEIWDEKMTKCERRFDPVFNRCVVFNTDSTSYHGNPVPVAHPDGLSRLSIALYYYTATWDGVRRSHTTQFRKRPGTADTFDWNVRVREALEEITPPLLLRAFRKIGRLVSR